MSRFPRSDAALAILLHLPVSYPAGQTGQNLFLPKLGQLSASVINLHPFIAIHLPTHVSVCPLLHSAVSVAVHFCPLAFPPFLIHPSVRLSNHLSIQ